MSPCLIDAADVETIVKQWLVEASVVNARQSVAAREYAKKYGFPLKIVFAVEGTR